MDNGQWTMDNGQWTMDNGQWTMDKLRILDVKKTKLVFQNKAFFGRDTMPRVYACTQKIYSNTTFVETHRYDNGVQ